MRRTDRELTDRVEIDGILDSAAELRLGLWDGNEVYVVPLNFVRIGDALFFHSSLEGRKIDIIRANPRVCFEVSGKRRIDPGKTGGDCTTVYESVIGWGNGSFVESAAEKNDILSALNKKFNAPPGPYADSLLGRVAVVRIRVDRLTAKANRGSM